MAFSFDSLAALILLATGIWSWRMARALRAGPRVHLRFAAVLLAAPAAALPGPSPDLAFNVLLLTAGVAGMALALAFCFRQGAPSWLSAISLVAAFAAGLIASLAAIPLLALAAVAGASAFILSAFPSRLKSDGLSGMAAILAAVSLLLGGLALTVGALAQAALFLAAALGLLARALQKPVEAAQAPLERLISAKGT